MNQYKHDVLNLLVETSKNKLVRALIAATGDIRLHKRLKLCYGIAEALESNAAEDAAPITEHGFAVRFPGEGGTQWDPANPDDKKLHTRLRLIRKCIETLRKDFSFPVLSVSGAAAVKATTPDDDSAPQASPGYFIPSDHQQVTEFLARTESEIRGVIASRIETHDAILNTFGIGADPFAKVKEALS